MMHKTSSTGIVVGLACVALVLSVAIAWWTLHEEEAEKVIEDTVPDRASRAAADGSDFGTPMTRVSEDAHPWVSKAATSVVTRVGDRFVWELADHERRDYLPDLRALANAGWAEAVPALAPVVADCIDNPPESEARLRRVVYDPVLQYTVGEDGEVREGAPPDENPEAAQAARDEWFQQLMANNREKQMTCRDAMPADPDRLMDWLELGLEQQPEGFVDAALSGRLMPEDTAWIVRNAERLAVFNLRLIGLIESRVMQGNPQALRQAWSVLAWGNFTPEPQPLRAYPYALAAGMLPQGTAAHIPGHSRTTEQVEHLLGRPLTASEAERARADAERIHARCCSSTISN